MAFVEGMKCPSLPPRFLDRLECVHFSHLCTHLVCSTEVWDTTLVLMLQSRMSEPTPRTRCEVLRSAHTAAIFTETPSPSYGTVSPASLLPLGPPGHTEPRVLTQAVEAEGAIVEEEADVACPCRHAAEGVRTAGCQWVNAAAEQQDEQGPGEGVLPRCLTEHHRHQFPQEVPASRKPNQMITAELIAKVTGKERKNLQRKYF